MVVVVVVLAAVWMIFFFLDTSVGFNQPGVARSIAEKYSILECSDGRGREEGEAERRRCCRASNDRCVSACVCVCVF